MFTPEAYHSQREESPPSAEATDDYLAPIWLRLIDGVHDLSSKGFFISTAFFVSLGARIIPDAVIIQVAFLVLTVIFFWIQKPSRASQKDIGDRRLTGVYIFLSTLLINWDAILLIFFRPVELMGKIFELWQWLSFGLLGLVVIGLIIIGVMAARPQEQQRYF